MSFLGVSRCILARSADAHIGEHADAVCRKAAAPRATPVQAQDDGKPARETRGFADGGRVVSLHPHRMSPTPTSLPLARCRDCASPLLQPLDVAGPVGGLSIVVRFCPECERTDSVVAQHSAVDAWLRRDEQIIAWMAASADALAAELAVDTHRR
jgi:hypothetical protein